MTGSSKGKAGTKSTVGDVRKRLVSIHSDSTQFLKPILDHFHCPQNGPSENATLRWPVVANERCGNWYAYPYTTASSAHFKSTDGHTGIYNFSLKRLNLPFLRMVSSASRRNGAVLIVDSSKYKLQPDSFSATLPLWCAVMNGLISYYNRASRVSASFGMSEYKEATDSSFVYLTEPVDSKLIQDDVELHTPPCLSPEQIDGMRSVISDRIQSALLAKVILDPKSFLDSAPAKPMRCFWIHNESDARRHETRLQELMSEIDQAQSEYSCIICINCSDCRRGKYDSEYISGGGDDEESWAMGLTSVLFWKHFQELIFKSCTEQQTMEAIKRIVSRAKCQNEEWFREEGHCYRSSCLVSAEVDPSFTSFFDQIGGSLLYIGSRRAGRPPECWKYFDAVVNVTTMEYNELSSDADGEIPDGKLYLQLPVKEGKRDKSELENWMAVAMLFIGVNLVQNKRILIHCAQGMDRSVAVAISVLCLYFELYGNHEGNNDIQMYSWCYKSLSYASFRDYLFEVGLDVDEYDDFRYYGKSGIPLRFVTFCKGKEGRNLFLSYMRNVSCRPSCEVDGQHDFFATKETLRTALIKIQQYRAKACPSRSTMQKLNRFFMSSF